MSIKIVATVFPSIALAFGGIMVMGGSPSGWVFVIVGMLAQAGYILTKLV